MVEMKLKDYKRNEKKYRQPIGIKGTMENRLSLEILEVPLLNSKLQKSELDFSTSKNR